MITKIRLRQNKEIVSAKIYINQHELILRYNHDGDIELDIETRGAAEVKYIPQEYIDDNMSGEKLNNEKRK